MASAMSGSRGRARRLRWTSLILGRLPLLALLGFLLLVHTARAQTAHEDPSDDAVVGLFVSSCEDLHEERTEVHGIVGVLGDIICPENRIFRVSETIDREVVFAASSPISFKGVHFEVPADTDMIFGAPGLNFEQGKDSTKEIFSVQGTLAFFADHSLPVPAGSTPEHKHSILRVDKGGSVESDGVVYFTDSGMTVAKSVVERVPTKEDSRWATRSLHSLHSFHQNYATDAPPLVSTFAPPFTTRETFEERQLKSPMYLKAGEEVIWPSSMTSLDGTVLTLGVDGSLLLKKKAAAAAVEAESDPVVVQPLVTLIAADFRKSNRALEKRLTMGGKAVDVDLHGRKDGLKVPGGAGMDAGGKATLKVTDVGDVEVSIDGKRVLHKTAPNNDQTWRRKIFDRLKGRKRPKGDYQMHLVSDGFEVRLDGDTVWGVHSADLPPVAS